MVLAIVLVLALDHAEGLLALSVARVDHLRRSQAHRRDVLRAGAGHAAARLHRRHHDALAAGRRRRRRAGLSAAGAFRSDLLGARHDHDLLHGDAVRDRADEFRRAAAARRARRGVSDAEFGELLAHRLGHAADQHLAGGRRIRQNRLGRLSAAQRAAILARRRRRLLSLVAADLRHRHADDRHQFRHHDPENARAGHELHAHAGVLLDRACLESAHRRRLSGSDRDLRDAAARPLSRLSLLFRRRPAATR